MKIRYGFVSNSSSSSFVGFTSLSMHRQAFSSLTETEQNLLQENLPFPRVGFHDSTSQIWVSYIRQQEEEYLQGVEMDDDYYNAPDGSLAISQAFSAYLEKLKQIDSHFVYYDSENE